MTDTGLSFNDKPVQPVQHGNKWVCPIEGEEVLQLSNGKFIHKPSQGFLDTFGVSLEQFIAEQEAES